ncbi:hypothetical protein EVJ58_g4823, partial [Rhodofomes roseus]
STSGLSAVFRTRSNTSGTALGAALTSPSTLSVHSISAPLTHTVIRTELTYPRTGPTPDQMKLLASVESFKRFGMPYGPDAIAFAASTSRVDLLPPPPVFEEVVGHSDTAENEAGTSAARSSGEDAVQEVQEDSPGSSPSSSPDPSLQIPPSEPATVGGAHEDDAASPPEAADSPSEDGPSQEPATEEASAKAPPTLSPYLPAQVTPAQPKEPMTADAVKKILRPLAPPSSFKSASVPAPLATPGSASSYMTFATAQEGESVPPTPAPDAEGLTVTVTGDEDAEGQGESELPSQYSSATPKNELRPLPDDGANTTIQNDEDTKPQEAETTTEEAVAVSSSDKAIPRKSLDTTSIMLPPPQADAPPVVAAQSEAVAA